MHGPSGWRNVHCHESSQITCGFMATYLYVYVYTAIESVQV